jgi:hypothetical protein
MKRASVGSNGKSGRYGASCSLKLPPIIWRERAMAALRRCSSAFAPLCFFLPQYLDVSALCPVAGKAHADNVILRSEKKTASREQKYQQTQLSKMHLVARPNRQNEQAERVGFDTMDTQKNMQVRAGYHAGVTRAADLLAGDDTIALFDQQLALVQVAANDTVAVIDHDNLAIVIEVLGERDNAIRDRKYWCASQPLEVGAAVVRSAAFELLFLTLHHFKALIYPLYKEGRGNLMLVARVFQLAASENCLSAETKALIFFFCPSSIQSMVFCDIGLLWFEKVLNVHLGNGNRVLFSAMTGSVNSATGGRAARRPAAYSLCAGCRVNWRTERTHTPGLRSVLDPCH